MNRIVREHYPVENLPEDLREHFAPGTSVTVEIAAEQTEAMPRPMTAQEAVALIREIQKLSRGKGRTTEEIVAEIRELRDEWDD